MTHPFENLITHLFRDSHQPDLLLQLAVIVGCGLAGWVMTLLISEILLTNHPDERRKRRAIRAIGVPLVWLFFTAVARSLLHVEHEVHLLNIAIPLLATLVSIRVAVHLVRHLTGNRESIRVWERIIVWTIWLGFALHITGLLPVVADLLDNVAFVSGNHRFSLLLLLEAIAVITIAVVTAMWLSQMIETRLMRTNGLDPSLRLALIKFLRTLLLIVGIVVALPAVGIDITILSVFGGALGVVLGLSLQKIASNYVAGFIILLDRSIRPGDMITVDGQYGEVRQLNTRYTLLRKLDGTEIILPNETLMTSTVVNHSFSQPEVRIQIPIQISYDSDVELARSILSGIANAHPRVLKSEQYTVDTYLTTFADSGINLALAVWVVNPEVGQVGLVSDIYLEVWREFRKVGIVIPYPRRDVHILPKDDAALSNPATMTDSIGTQRAPD